MGFIQGIQAGEQSANMWEKAALPRFNPYQAMAYIKRPTAAPRIIRDNAAEIALKQKALELEERKVAAMEQAARANQDMAERVQEHQENLDWEKMGIADRAQGLAERKEGFEEQKWATAKRMTQQQKQRQNDFALAKWGLAVNNPKPIIDYFNKYGEKKANIEQIQFGPDNDLLVKFSGIKKPAYFRSKDEFYSSLMVFADPKVQEALIKQKTELAKAAINARGKKGQKNPLAVNWSQAAKEYDVRYKDPAGNYKPNAPDRETWIRNYILEHQALGTQGAGQQRTGAARQPDYEDVVSPRTGDRLRRWSDGIQEVIAPNGEVKAVKGPNGIEYLPGSLGFEKYRRTRLPIGKGALPQQRQAATGQAKTLTPPQGFPDMLTPPQDYWENPAKYNAAPSPPPPKAQVQGPQANNAIPQKGARTRGPKQVVKATYVDKATSNTVEVTVDAKGNVHKRVIKKAKKRKKKKG